MRKSTLELPEKVYLTIDAKKKLKELKKIKKQSMAQIVINLIDKEYGNEKL